MVILIGDKKIIPFDGIIAVHPTFQERIGGIFNKSINKEAKNMGGKSYTYRRY